MCFKIDKLQVLMDQIQKQRNQTVYFKDINLVAYNKLKNILKMQGSNRNQALRDLYQSKVRCSYFRTMDADYLKKSRISFINNSDNQKIDDKTYRLNAHFKQQDQSFITKKRNDRMYIEQQGFFSCISTRKKYQVTLKNTQFRVQSSEKLYTFLDFNLVAAKVEEHNKYFKIVVKGCKEEFYYEPVERESVKQWVIRQSDGLKNDYTYLADSIPNFYKSQTISNEEFLKNANSGDILLFRSQHSAARAQQFITNSQYDHVGIVLRNANNQLHIFESTSNEGVGITPWRDLIKYEWYKCTEKICWRKLKAKLTNHHIDIIEQFFIKTIGKGFQINLDKLMTFNSKIVRSKQQQQEKTYFCSQLAARLYKELGFFDAEKASSTYYPVDFSQKGSLKFVGSDISLDCQKIISFDGAK